MVSVIGTTRQDGVEAILLAPAITAAFIDPETVELDVPNAEPPPTLATVLAEGADAGGSPITGLADPSSAQDAATKAYVDAIIPLPRIAAGVPTGAPTAGENGMAIDTTAVTGGVYGWSGAAWVKGASI